MPIYRVGDLVHWKEIDDLDALGLILEIDPNLPQIKVLWSDDEGPGWYPTRNLIPVQPADPCDIT